MRKNTLQRPSTNLARLRLEAGFSQRALALAAAVHSNTVRYAEIRGSIPMASAQRRIAAALSEQLDRKVDPVDIWPLIENGKAA